MRSSSLLLVVNGALCAGVILVLVAQHRENRDLRHQLATTSTASRAAPVLAPPLSAEPGDDTNHTLHADEEALPRLRAELDELQRRLEAPPSAEPSTLTTMWSTEDWFDAGADTPVNAMLTCLWAASRGHVDALASLLELTPQSRERTLDLLRAGPPEHWTDYATPERYLARRAASELAVSSVELLRAPAASEVEKGWAGLRVKVTYANGQTRLPTLLTVRRGAGWKLIVPTSPVHTAPPARPAAVP